MSYTKDDLDKAFKAWRDLDRKHMFNREHTAVVQKAWKHYCMIRDTIIGKPKSGLDYEVIKAFEIEHDE